VSELALWEGLDTTVEFSSGTETWKEQPVDFDTFVRDHLRIPPMYARQRKAVRKLLGDDPTRTFEEGRQYQILIALWGKGSGKDYLCSVVVCYLIYILLCLRNPQEYFDFGPGESIDVLNVAYSSDQAKYVFFAKLTERVKRWTWLRERFNVLESGRRIGPYIPGRESVEINADHILFPRHVRAFSRHAQNESYEGMNVIAWIMDEASAFLSKLKRENADAIFGTLRSSANTRFPGRWVGAVISYPRHADDFTMTKLKEAQANPDGNTYADGPATTWDVNDRVAHETMVEIRPGHLVPVTFVNDYRDDYEGSLAKYECEPPASREAFFRFPDRLDDSVVRGRAPLIDWEEVITYKTVDAEDEDGKSVERRRQYSSIKLTRLGKLPKGTKVFAHGDPGKVNDSFTLALAHGAPATVMVKVPASEVLDAREILERGLTPEAIIDWERDVVKTVVDAVLVWRPNPALGQQVDFENVQDILLQLKKAYGIGFRAPKPTLTFDHWNSAGIVQALQGKRMNAEEEHWGRDFQVDVYRNARSCFYNDLVVLPDTDSVTSEDPREPGALYELKRVQFIDAVKIDHPENGSKDTADSVCRVICHVTWAVKSGFSWATAFGHPNQYNPAAVPVPGKNFALPRMATPDAIDADNQQRLAAPLGEIVPSEGTINGQRYASISGKR
jgi:hypothetical protein